MIKLICGQIIQFKSILCKPFPAFEFFKFFSSKRTYAEETISKDVHNRPTSSLSSSVSSSTSSSLTSSSSSSSSPSSSSSLSTSLANETSSKSKIPFKSIEIHEQDLEEKFVKGSG